MDFPTIVTISRKSRRKLRRRRILRVAFLVVSSLLVLWSFAAGVVWHRLKSKPSFSQAALAPVNEAQRAEALRLLDEGVRARFEQRWQMALNSISAARSADPQARGVDILIGEIALEQNDPETLRRATERSLSTGENEGAAKLLRAVETWMKRGERGVDQAGLLAGQYLAEAAQSEPSKAAVHFFHGELSRLLGDGKEAHRHLRSALYRQAPWDSSALLEVKMQLGAREASDAGTPVVVAAPTAQAEAALLLSEVVRSGGVTETARADLFVITPALQSVDLLADKALGGGADQDVARKLRQQVENGIPLFRAGFGAQVQEE